MSVKIATLTRNNAGNAIVDLLDIGTANPNGYIELRTGAKPTSPQVAATGTLLGTGQFSKPAYGAFVNGTAIANPITTDDSLVASGICGWFRMYNCDGQAIMDGDVTITGGGGDLEFDTIDFVQGGNVVISELDAVMPE
jgi:hypothetical protein